GVIGYVEKRLDSLKYSKRISGAYSVRISGDNERLGQVHAAGDEDRRRSSFRQRLRVDVGPEKGLYSPHRLRAPELVFHLPGGPSWPPIRRPEDYRAAGASHAMRPQRPLPNRRGISHLRGEKPQIGAPATDQNGCRDRALADSVRVRLYPIDAPRF